MVQSQRGLHSRTQSLVFSASKRYVVVTDIANYYDFISYDHLRNILADFSLAREHALDLLLYALSYMLWQPDYMPRIPVGLPQIKVDAPRLLAHCFLFEIDEVLLSKPQLEFARYMDDIDIGTDTLSEAKLILRDLDLALQTRQIRLNSGKTKIMSAEEALEHFKIRENALLDRLADRIEAARSAGKSLKSESRLIELAMRAGFRRTVFSTGNGEKILKRLINLAAMVGANVEDAVFCRILEDYPASPFCSPSLVAQKFISRTQVASACLVTSAREVYRRCSLARHCCIARRRPIAK